jgi:hypothetical protein
VIGPLEALAARLDEVAAGMQGIERRDDRNSITWLRDGRLYAAMDGTGIEFRLETAIAAAAVRTPDTTTSARGPEWVRFAPTELDQYAVDRAIAWFEAAWRRAER